MWLVPCWSCCFGPFRHRGQLICLDIVAPSHRTGRQLRLCRQLRRLRRLSASPWLVRSLIPSRSRDPSWLPARNQGVLPAPVIVADEDNNRLVIIGPQGRTLMGVPRPGDLVPGQSFIRPSDVFFTPDGNRNVANQEEDQVVSIIDIGHLPHPLPVWTSRVPDRAQPSCPIRMMQRSCLTLG